MTNNFFQYIVLFILILSIISIWLMPTLIAKYSSKIMPKNHAKTDVIIAPNIAIQLLNYSHFISKIKNNELTEIVIKTNGIINEIISLDSDNNKYATEIIASSINDILEICREQNIHVTIENIALNGMEKTSFKKQLLFALLPTALLIGFFMLNKQSAMNLNTMNVQQAQNVNTKFTDVVALESEKKEIVEIVDYLVNAEKYAAIGATIPRGVLLIGPPGNGKTLLARAIAGEASVPFLYAAGSEFLDAFVGVGAAKIRAIFEQASQYPACIIFIDEIDTIGMKRDVGLTHGSNNSILNQLLIEMDGFKEKTNIIVIAATNRHDVLDPALVRRFTRQIHISNPDAYSRRLIIQYYLNKIKVSQNVSVNQIAQLTAGLSSSALKTLINDAAILAARANKPCVTMTELNDAITRVSIGLERTNLIMTPAEKRLTAYHEAGHAIVAACTPNAIPVHKVTIVARGNALGYVQQISEDRVSVRISELKARLVVAMGGIAAEILKNGVDNVTTGPASDIQYATEIAKSIVEHGFSDTMGPVKYIDIKLLPESYKHKMMEEIQKLIVDAKNQALTILKNHKHDLEKVANALMEKETLTADEFHALLSIPPYYTTNKSWNI